MDFKGKVTGFDELNKLLTQLPGTVENKILQGAVTKAQREGARSIRNAAPVHLDKQSAASQKYGPIRRNIRVIRLRRVQKGQKGARIDTGNAFWGYIYELGSRYQPARAWFAPAYRSMQETIIRVLGVEIGKGIEAEAAKYKGGKR